MKLPLILVDNLDNDARDKWQKQFVATGRDRHEGLWKRTQEPKTAPNSGYKTPADARWRLVQFYDKYDLVEGENGYSLQLENPYLHINTALPTDEAEAYLVKILKSLTKGKWDVSKKGNLVSAKRGDLRAEIVKMDRDEIEEKAQRKLRKGYEALNITVKAKTEHVSDEEKEHVWEVMRRPMRVPPKAGKPKVVDTNFSELKKYVPFQMEMGCGPSIEAGVPPLCYLHHIYAVSDPETHDFKLSADDDLFVRLFSDPEEFYRQAAMVYSQSMIAKPTTKFYKMMKRLGDDGQLIGPIFTNNYDGLISAIDFKEFYMRRFSTYDFIPDVEFDPRAKALVVVGSHADRRLLQKKARADGLKVIFVDPECYDDSGRSFDYKIESPQDEDILISATAEDFANMLARDLGYDQI